METISRKENYNANKLHKRLRRLVGSAITDSTISSQSPYLIPDLP